MQKKIRRAQSNYHCDCCGSIITSGSDYEDNFEQDSYGNWNHRRICMNCVNPNTTIFEKVFNELNKSGPFVMSLNGEKVTVVGVSVGLSLNKYIQVKPWNSNEAYYLTIKEFSNYLDYNGNPM